MQQSKVNLPQQFPFAAVTSQPQFKLALLLNAINPLIGGVLVSGPRGSAKSTLAKGLATILPTTDCGKNQPFVTLPLSTGEEMLVGTLDLQRVLNDKDVAFQPGLLAKAHQGILYVDEVNLLPDFLVDQLLDVAASGINIVERDGLSHQHPARFILLGTMNPDEGELRAQLIDRFGLSLTLANDYSVEERVNIVKLREAFDKNPAAFCEQYQQQQIEITQTIAQARTVLSDIACPESCRLQIAQECHNANVDGMRADIVWVQAAIAHAALHHRLTVTEDDVLAVKALVLNHRRNEPDQPPEPPFKRPESKTHSAASDSSSSQSSGDWGQMPPQDQAMERLLSPVNIDFDSKNNEAGNSHKLIANNASLGSAKGLKKSSHSSTSIHWFGSLLKNAGKWPLQHLQFKPSKRGTPVIHLVLLDTSGSVLSNKSFSRAKGLIAQVAQQAYLKREQIAILGFGNQAVSTLLSPRRSPKTIEQCLDGLKAGGGTPLQKAIEEALQFQKRYLKKTPASMFKNYIITDGRVNNFSLSESLNGDSVVIDIESSQVKRGKAKQIADLLHAQYFLLRA